MSEQVRYQADKLSAEDQAGENLKPETSVRKKFIEPEISKPVDVLEATTFFQAVDSGPTN